MIAIKILLVLISWGVIHYGVICLWKEDFEEALKDVPLAFITALLIWLDYLLMAGRIQIVN